MQYYLLTLTAIHEVDCSEDIVDEERAIKGTGMTQPSKFAHIIYEKKIEDLVL